MITIRPQKARGQANFGWLDSRHTFSFGNYYDSQHMGFANLRVINEDRVTPGKGFGTHGHRDMEIISYVLSGGLRHQDSMGNGSVIRPGDVQRMSAGTGITHSEFNASTTEPVHFLQIWILPQETGLTPSYEEKNFATAVKSGKLTLVGSQNGRDDSVTIHQDVNLYVGSLNSGDRINYPINSNRAVWIQVTKGSVLLNGQLLEAGDGAAIVNETDITLVSHSDDGEILLFDMAHSAN